MICEQSDFLLAIRLLVEVVLRQLVVGRVGRLGGAFDIHGFRGSSRDGNCPVLLKEILRGCRFYRSSRGTKWVYSMDER